MAMTQFNVPQETHNWLKENKIDCVHFESTTSTNDVAKNEALNLSTDLKVYVAQFQTAGRGRGQNQWITSRDPNSLIITWSYKMASSPQALTGPLLGLALYRALKNSFHLSELSLKAPNDIYLDGKKIGGLLTEVVGHTHKLRLIVGIGLNIFSRPQEVSESSFLNAKTNVTLKLWTLFLSKLKFELDQACKSSLETFLTDQQRDELLGALNNNTSLVKKYQSVSPFGDLSTGDKIISWRDL